MCDNDSSTWERLTPTLTPAPQYTVKGLVKNHYYKFRVRAENIIGLSEPAELEQTVLAKDPYGESLLIIYMKLLFQTKFNKCKNQQSNEKGQ